MLATICDDTWNMLNMQHVTPNSERWDYSEISGGGMDRLKDPPAWLKVTQTHPSAGGYFDTWIYSVGIPIKKLRSSYLYNGNSYTWKNSLYDIENGHR